MKEFIENSKKEYKKINKVFCPYFNKDIWFTMKGFRHLIRTCKGNRDVDEIISRLSAIKYIAEIVSKSGTVQEFENNGIEFLGFIAIIDSKKFKVIILKDRDNEYKFISVIPKYQTGIRDITTKDLSF
jgi:hypothetical protein